MLHLSKTGGKGGIRTRDTGHPVYWFSKPAPSASRPPFRNLFPLCGGGRIRTFGGREPSAVFKTAALGRSATPPESVLVPSTSVRRATWPAASPPIYGTGGRGSRGERSELYGRPAWIRVSFRVHGGRGLAAGVPGACPSACHLGGPPSARTQGTGPIRGSGQVTWDGAGHISAAMHAVPRLSVFFPGSSGSLASLVSSSLPPDTRPGGHGSHAGEGGGIFRKARADSRRHLLSPLPR